MGIVVSMRLNPPGQYADDRNLYARQRLWQHQVPFFNVVGWVLGLAGLAPGMRVLDAGCGNGAYLRALAGYAVRTAGCDLRRDAPGGALSGAVLRRCRRPPAP